MRKIGTAAGVDAKLIHYYFGTKEDLFTAAISEVFRSRGLPDILSEYRPEATDSPGTHYIRAVLTTLETPTIGPAFTGLLRSLGTHEESQKVFLRFVNEELLERLAPQLPVENATTRLALAGTQIFGLIYTRYILKIPPLTELSIEQTARLIGPTLDTYMRGPLE
jgi:transcriptional regulator, TetR family